MRIVLFFFSLWLFVSCDSTNKSKENVTDIKMAAVSSKEIALEVYDFNGLQKFLEQKDGKVHVVNFWATWCGPCVKELPHFEKIGETYKDHNVEVLLVSLDFPTQYDKKLKPFLQKHNIQSKVVALDDVAQDTWIPKVDPTWSGALPATIIYKNETRKFFEQSFTYEELENEIKQFLK